MIFYKTESEPEFHGNPVKKGGILSTMEWGMDIAESKVKKTQTPTTIIRINKIKFGIHAEYIDVLESIRRMDCKAN